jgi:hypothetical protein
MANGRRETDLHVVLYSHAGYGYAARTPNAGGFSDRRVAAGAPGRPEVQA